MKISIDLGSWTSTKAALAVAGALVIGGAVGSALAVSPTMPAPIKWAGGIPAISAFFGNPTPLYTVPAGRNLMLTDVIVSNHSDLPGTFFLSAGTGNCASSQPRLEHVAVPAHSTLAIPLVTGYGFTAGQTLCLLATGPALQANVRGFLFTPA